MLVPDEIDRFTGYRYYSAEKLSNCNCIIALKELGFSLDDIQVYLHSGSEEDIVTLIDRKTAELQTSIHEKETQLTRLYAVKQIITEGEVKMFDLAIKNSDSLRIAAVRKIWNSKEEACTALEMLKKKIPSSLKGTRSIIINYETEYRERDFDLAVGVEIRGNLPKNSEYQEQIITFSGDIASIVCRRDELDSAYRAIERQLHDYSAQIVGAFHEIEYIDGTIELKVPIVRLSECEVTEDVNFSGAFENDDKAVGAWKFVDLVPSKEQYSANNRKYGNADSFWLKDLYFLPNGEGYWIIHGWTKGMLYCQNGEGNAKYKYSIKTVNDETMLFLEMHNDHFYKIHGGKPQICVYRKIDGIERSPKDIRIRDNVNYPLIPDNEALGKWTVCDFCRKIEVFDPNKNIGKEISFAECRVLS